MTACEIGENVTVACPDCGEHRTFMRKEWMQSIKDWKNGKDRDGNTPTLHCYRCGKSLDARKWHRNLEQQVFAQAHMGRAA